MRKLYYVFIHRVTMADTVTLWQAVIWQSVPSAGRLPLIFLAGLVC